MKKQTTNTDTYSIAVFNSWLTPSYDDTKFEDAMAIMNGLPDKYTALKTAEEWMQTIVRANNADPDKDRKSVATEMNPVTRNNPLDIIEYVGYIKNQITPDYQQSRFMFAVYKTNSLNISYDPKHPVPPMTSPANDLIARVL